jgi:hypothetical protein
MMRPNKDWRNKIKIEWANEEWIKWERMNKDINKDRVS